MTELTTPNFQHLFALQGPYGTFEHAKGAVPRIEHGYCTDDVARVGVVISRQSDQSLDSRLSDLLWSSLHFLEQAQHANGTFLNRRECSGAWESRATSNDCWGRAMWGLGTMSARSQDPALRERATAAFERGASVRSSWPRAMAFATLGASEVLRASPENYAARQLLDAGVVALDRESLTADWRWSEERLTYANAALPEALIAAGVYLGYERIVDRGLDQLRWLLESETRDGHLSVTPAGGRGPHEELRRFDQQPIEVAALADACARADILTGDPTWRSGRELCEGWFVGENDAEAVMFDVRSGGGYDGLTASGPNINQGAESTLALLMVQQHAHRAAMAIS
ncbi:MAG: glycosyltransferase [Acidimicrobiaceae bacterium]|nr:glycosyltransferase [Acidimicrobiaceae bacterium]